MAMELISSPIMVPLALTEAMLCHVHRQASRYTPRIVPLDSSQTSLYSIVPSKRNPSFLEEAAFCVIDVKKGCIIYEFKAKSSFCKSKFDFYNVETLGSINGDYKQTQKSNQATLSRSSVSLAYSSPQTRTDLPLNSQVDFSQYTERIASTLGLSTSNNSQAQHSSLAKSEVPSSSPTAKTSLYPSEVISGRSSNQNKNKSNSTNSKGDIAYKIRHSTTAISKPFFSSSTKDSKILKEAQKRMYQLHNKARLIKSLVMANNSQERLENTDTESGPLASISAGIWSFIDIKTPLPETLLSSYSQLFLGTNFINHQSDFLDNYRVFQLSDGLMYQWTKRGMFLERVYNLGQKDSEVRERCARVMAVSNATNGGYNEGFTIEIDETKISREVAFLTAMVSYLDQWNTAIGVGGVYLQLSDAGTGGVPWRRITRN